jgi:hypothetical protein
LDVRSFYNFKMRTERPGTLFQSLAPAVCLSHSGVVLLRFRQSFDIDGRIPKRLAGQRLRTDDAHRGEFEERCRCESARTTASFAAS